MKKFEYLRRVYDSESMMDFDLTKLGVAGWQLCGVVRYNPSPARVTFMAWYLRELPTTSKKIQREQEEVKKFGLFGPEVKRIGDAIGRVPAPLAPPIPWPELVPGVNPFETEDDDSEDDN